MHLAFPLPREGAALDLPSVWGHCLQLLSLGAIWLLCCLLNTCTSLSTQGGKLFPLPTVTHVYLHLTTISVFNS